MSPPKSVELYYRVYQMTQGMLAEFGMEPAKRGSKMINESGQYRNAVASGELRHINDSLDYKADRRYRVPVLT
jgi:hypothetical protein